MTYPVSQIEHEGHAAAAIRAAIGDADCEHLVALLIGPRNGIQAIHTVSVGTLGTCAAAPRDIFKAAIAANAAAIILGHNHPSGDPSPSEPDLAFTRRAVESSKILGIPILDHVIVGDGTSYSMREHGTGGIQ